MRFSLTVLLTAVLSVVGQAQDNQPQDNQAQDNQPAQPQIDKDRAPQQANDAPTLETNRQKVSYAIGMNIGRQFKQNQMDLDPQIVAQGIATVLAGEDAALSQEEIQAAMQAFQAEQQKQRQMDAEDRKGQAEQFFTQNAEREEVEVTESGLQYRVLKEGTGQKPTSDSTVTTHYRGRFLDGEVFDQSYEGETPTADDEPISFGVTGVIPGWTEALQLMKTGGHWRLFVPADLAYGAEGRPGIPPGSPLIFDIYLLGAE